MAVIRDREHSQDRFRAALHGVELADRAGRVAGMRQRVMERMKRRGAH